MRARAFKRYGTWLCALVLVSLCGPTWTARAEKAEVSWPRPSSFGEQLSAKTKEQLILEVPLVRLSAQEARVVMVNTKELQRLGFPVPPNGKLTAALQAELLKALAFRPATPEEIKAKRYTHLGKATRYADKRPKGEGVTGDGRAALIGDVLVRDLNGKVEGVYDIQLKGVGTALRPWHWGNHNGEKQTLREKIVDKYLADYVGQTHKSGTQPLWEAISDAFLADYLATNGVRTNNWLAVIHTNKPGLNPLKRFFPQALFIRGGNFMRLAHLQQLRDDPKGMRELIDLTNKQLSMELGRKQPLSLPGLYKQLCQRKADELAKLYWLRTVHGSPTYHNIGLMEMMDHGTVSTVDRTHKDYSFFADYVGYGGEPEFVMNDYFRFELYRHLMTAATPAEKRAMRQLDPKRMTRNMLHSAMSYQALLHLGFSEQDAAKVMKHDRQQVKHLEIVLKRIADVTEPGATHQMGPGAEATAQKHIATNMAKQALATLVNKVADVAERWTMRQKGPKGAVAVENPARYDLFPALDKLVALQLKKQRAQSSASEAQQYTVAKMAKQLVPVLRKGEATGKDLAAAIELVKAFDNVVTKALEGMSPEERFGRLQLMKEGATLRNRSVAKLVRKPLNTYAAKIAARVGITPMNKSLDKVQNEIDAFMADNNVVGPGSPVHAAERLMAGNVERTRDGKIVLSQTTRSGMHIEELSDGTHELLRVSVATMTSRDQQLDVRRGAGTWKKIGASRVENGQAVFEIPLKKGSPGRLQARIPSQGFWRRSAGCVTVDPVSKTKGVQVGLALEAQRHGQTRELRAPLRAVATAAYRREMSRGRGVRR